MIIPCAAPKKCMNCNNNTIAKGLCKSCYQSNWHKLRRKKIRGYDNYLDDGFFYGQKGYFTFDDNDNCQCHICGKWFKHVGIHVVSTHRIDLELYREEFGLSMKQALCSLSISSNLSVKLKEREEIYGAHPAVELQRKNILDLQKLRTNSPPSLQSKIKHSNTLRATKGWQHGNKKKVSEWLDSMRKGYQEHRILKTCSCGKKYYSAPHNLKRRCNQCKKKLSQARALDWMIKKYGSRAEYYRRYRHGNLLPSS